jgi:hypothetical protein
VECLISSLEQLYLPFQSQAHLRCWDSGSLASLVSGPTTVDAGRAPNNRVQATGNKFRSYLAPLVPRA